MRISVILPHMMLFGGVRRYIEIGNILSRRGHEYTIYTPEGTAPDWMGFEGKVERLEDLGSAGHDVLMTGSPEYAGYLEGAGAGVKIFYLQIEGVEGERKLVTSGMYRIMVNSSGLARRIRKKYGIEPLLGIGGVNPALFHPVPDVRRLERGNSLRILCYGRLSRPRKGTRFVIEALRRMRRSGYDVELHLFDAVTDGCEDPRAGFDPGVPYRYYLDLPQERMAAMYSSADVFVSAEKRAGWSNTSAEAAACGLPLVCTASGTSDFASGGENAIVLPVRNSFFIGRALRRLYGDRALLERMGSASREKMLDFTWDRVCDSMERDFFGLIDGSTGD